MPNIQSDDDHVPEILAQLCVRHFGQLPFLRLLIVSPNFFFCSNLFDRTRSACGQDHGPGNEATGARRPQPAPSKSPSQSEIEASAEYSTDDVATDFPLLFRAVILPVVCGIPDTPSTPPQGNWPEPPCICQ